MQMEETFGGDAPLSVSRGKVHNYLGMNLDFRVKGEVWIDMEHYIHMMLHDTPNDMEGVSTHLQLRILLRQIRRIQNC